MEAVMQQLELFTLEIEELKQILLNLPSREWFQIKEYDENLFELLKPIRAELKRREHVIKRERDRKERLEVLRRKYHLD